MNITITKENYNDINIFDSLQKAFDTVKALLQNKTINSNENIYITLQKGIYEGLLSYDIPNPLYIVSEAGANSSDCVIRAENCEAFHKDTENRAVFVIGKLCTKVVLKGFTIENTHIKTSEDVALANQAEALCFHNQTGTLFAKDLRLISRQDTLHTKGFSVFENCYITGDVDFIWGYCDLSLFYKCHIHSRKDNRGDRDSYVLQSRAINGKKGFVFKDCIFSCDKRQNASVYIARSSGKGSNISPTHWDSIALIDCIIKEGFAPNLYTTEGGRTQFFPKGQCNVGLREYNTVLQGFTKNLPRISYILTKEEYEKFYSTLYLIAKGTPLQNILSSL